VDRFISRGETHEAFVKGTYCDAGDFAGAEYEVITTERGAVFSRSASLDTVELSITKEVSVNKEGGFSITSAISKKGDGVLDGYSYGLEFNVLLPGCDGPFSSFEVVGGDGVVERFGLKESLELKGVSFLRAVDGFAGAVFCLSMEQEASVWSFPIYTVTLSEAGFERCFQGSTILLLFPLKLRGDKEGIFKVGFSLEKLNS
jgi:alpha-amylase